MITQDVLHTLAAIGVPQRIHAMEQELTAYYAEWPHLFSAAPTIAGLVNGHTNGNGHAPAAAPAAPEPAAAPKRTRSEAMAASWTPERRARQARAMRRRSRAMHAAKRAKKTRRANV